jgi:hypothetical protein
VLTLTDYPHAIAAAELVLHEIDPARERGRYRDLVAALAVLYVGYGAALDDAERTQG